MKYNKLLLAGLFTIIPTNLKDENLSPISTEARLYTAIKELEFFGFKDNFDVRYINENKKLEGTAIFIVEDLGMVEQGKFQPLNGIYQAEMHGLLLHEGKIFLRRGSTDTTIYAELLHHYLLKQKNIILRSLTSEVSQGNYTLSGRVDESIAVIVDEAVSHALAHRISGYPAELGSLSRYKGIPIISNYINEVGIDIFISEYKRNPVSFWKDIKNNVPEFRNLPDLE
jgi:hypothetical protein